MKLNQGFVITIFAIVWLALEIMLRFITDYTFPWIKLLGIIFSIILGIIIYLHITKEADKKDIKKSEREATNSFFELIIKIGAVFSYIFGILSLIFMMIMIIVLIKNPSLFNDDISLILLTSSTILGILFIFTGRGLQKKRKWVKVTMIILAVLSAGYLLSFSPKVNLFSTIAGIIGIIGATYYIFFHKPFADIFS